MAEALRQLGLTVTADEARLHRSASPMRPAPLPPATAPQSNSSSASPAPPPVSSPPSAPPPRAASIRLDGVPQMRRTPHARPHRGAPRPRRRHPLRSGEDGIFPASRSTPAACAAAPCSLDASREQPAPLRPPHRRPARRTRPVAVALAAEVRRPVRRDDHAPHGRDLGYAHRRRSPAAEPYVLNPGRYDGPARYARRARRHRRPATSSRFPLRHRWHVSTCPHLRGPGDGLQGDTHFAAVLARVGAVIRIHSHAASIRASFPRPTCSAASARVQPESPTPSSPSPRSPRSSPARRASPASRTPASTETDRVAGMARELTRPRPARRRDRRRSRDRAALPCASGETIETYRRPPLRHEFRHPRLSRSAERRPGLGSPIKDPACCAKTFPHFFELLETVRQNSLAS